MVRVIVTVACALAAVGTPALEADAGTESSIRMARVEWVGHVASIEYGVDEDGTPCPGSYSVSQLPEIRQHAKPMGGDTATLELSLDENPDWVVVYREHPAGELALAALFSRPESPVVIEVEPGVYDVLVEWMPSFRDPDRLVIREDVPLPIGGTQLSISIGEAVHLFQMRPVDESGVGIEHTVTPGTILWRNGLLVVRTDGLQKPLDGILFSPLSGAFTLEASTLTVSSQSAAHGVPLYVHHGSFHEGISQDIILEYEPQDLHRMVLSPHVDAAAHEVVVVPCLGTRPWGLDPSLDIESSYEYETNCRQLGLPGLLPSTVQTVYTVPLPYPWFYTGYVNFQVYRHMEPEEPYDASDYLYSTPILGWLDGVKGYYGGAETVAVYEGRNGVVESGLGPWFWYGRFANSEAEIRFGSSIGYELWPFISQSGAMRRTLSRGEFPYRLLRSGEVVGEGEFTIEHPWREHAFVVEPGNLTLEVGFAPPVGPGHAYVAASMSTTAPDPDPPFLTHLSLTHQGNRVQEMICPGGSLTMRARDDDSGVAAVTASYLAEDGPRSLAVEAGLDGEHMIAFDGSLVPTNPTDLTLALTDRAGNALEMTLTLPAYNRRMPRRPATRTGG